MIEEERGKFRVVLSTDVIVFLFFFVTMTVLVRRSVMTEVRQNQK